MIQLYGKLFFKVVFLESSLEFRTSISFACHSNLGKGTESTLNESESTAFVYLEDKRVLQYSTIVRTSISITCHSILGKGTESISSL